MIVMMLFLILFAILFPRALRLLFVLLFVLGIVILGEVHAKPVRCLLTVDHKIYIDDVCDYDEEKDGSFTIGANGKSRYFAYIFPGSNSYWNGESTSTHAHDSLGVLSKSGACWKNDRVKVCTWTERKHATTPRQNFEYYTPGRMYSGPLGAHIGSGPHVMAPYTGW